MLIINIDQSGRDFESLSFAKAADVVSQRLHYIPFVQIICWFQSSQNASSKT